jgi:hypothetical protein
MFFFSFLGMCWLEILLFFFSFLRIELPIMNQLIFFNLFKCILYSCSLDRVSNPRPPALMEQRR